MLWKQWLVLSSSAVFSVYHDPQITPVPHTGPNLKGKTLDKNNVCWFCMPFFYAPKLLARRVWQWIANATQSKVTWDSLGETCMIVGLALLSQRSSKHKVIHSGFCKLSIRLSELEKKVVQRLLFYPALKIIGLQNWVCSDREANWDGFGMASISSCVIKCSHKH